MLDLPDGTNPGVSKAKWMPWVQGCMRLLDSDGAYLAYPASPVLDDNPWIDMEIYDTIRYESNALRNEELKHAPRH